MCHLFREAAVAVPAEENIQVRGRTCPFSYIFQFFALFKKPTYGTKVNDKVSVSPC